MNLKCIKRILALDLSLNHAGVAWTTEGGTGAIHTQTVNVQPLRVPGKRAGTEKNGPALVGVARLLWWREWLQGILNQGWDLVIMELPAMSSQTGVLAFGRQMGVVETCLADAGVPFVLVTISEVKKYATGFGKADKLRMVETAQAAFGPDVQGEDEADAAWLCKIACDAFGCDMFGCGEKDTDFTSNPYRQSVAARLRKSLENGGGLA